MRFPIAVLACSFFAATLAQPLAAQIIQRLDGSTITAAEANIFARKTLAAAHVTGAEIAVLNHGHLVWSAGFGLRRVDPVLPMTPDTNIWAASITKSVFSTYVMKLVQEGKFNLDTPIAQQLAKPLDEYEPYRETGTELVKDPRWQTITPRMLLAHTSGLANFAFLEPDKKMHLHFKPGTNFKYSGEGINLVQFVIEQKLGEPLELLMRKALFDPLSMANTALVYQQKFAANVADRYDLDGKFLSQTRRDHARAAGSMATSANDLARFLEALFANRIVDAQTRAEMFHPYFRIHSLHQFGPDMQPRGKEADRVSLAYGVGWGLLTHTRYGPAFFKEGHGDGAQNYLICFERSQSCMIVLTNSDNGEITFRPLFEKILGDTVTPWEWEGYTPSYIEQAHKNGW